MFGRTLAPISDAAWKEIDVQAARTLKANLAARRFVDVKGPFGWEYSAVPAGRFDAVQSEGGVGYGVRQSVPLVETRIGFELNTLEIHNVDRGLPNPDLAPVEKAAIAAAAFEDKVVFEGLANASIRGLKCENTSAAIELPSDPEAFVLALADATDKLSRTESISGPYALVGGAALRAALNKLVYDSTLLGVVQKYTSVDEFIFAPNAEASYLVSKRGGDFELTLGMDFIIGYTNRIDDTLKLYLAESFSFRVLEPRAYAPVTLK